NSSGSGPTSAGVHAAGERSSASSACVPSGGLVRLPRRGGGGGSGASLNGRPQDNRPAVGVHVVPDAVGPQERDLAGAQGRPGQLGNLLAGQDQIAHSRPPPSAASTR